MKATAFTRATCEDWKHLTLTLEYENAEAFLPEESKNELHGESELKFKHLVHLVWNNITDKNKERS